MKAARRSRYGGSEQIHIEEVPPPSPARGQLLIRVHASTVSRTDCALLGAHPFVLRFMTGLLRPKLATLGTDFAGEVSEIGQGVTGFAPGERVWGINDMGAQSHAEYTAISTRDAVALMPDGMSYEHAAASLEGPWYAHSMLVRAGFRGGHRVLINGATGAIGSALLQLCVRREASVTAVGNGKNLALLRSLGARRVVNYEQQDFTQEDGPYDFVFDAVGKSTFGACKHLLKPGGAYVSSELGPHGQNLLFALTTRWLGPHRVVFPVPIPRQDFLREMGHICADFDYRPVIDRSYPLAEAAEAYAYAASGQKTGSLILRP